MNLEHLIGFALSGIGIGFAMQAGQSRIAKPEGWAWLGYLLAGVLLTRFGWFLVYSK